MKGIRLMWFASAAALIVGITYAIAPIGDLRARRATAAQSTRTYSHAIIVKYDAYGVPIRCEWVLPEDVSVEVYGGGFVERRFASVGVVINDYSVGGLTVAYLNHLNGAATTAAFRSLGLTERACAEIQRRTFDPATDQYLTPEELAGEPEKGD